LHESAAEMLFSIMESMCCVYVGSSAHVVVINLSPDHETNLGRKYPSHAMNLFCVVMVQGRLLLGRS